MITTSQGELTADVLVVGHRPAVRPADPRHPRARGLPRPGLPLLALGPRLRPGGQAGRGGRHRRLRDPDRARRSSRWSNGSPSCSAPRRGSCRGWTAGSAPPNAGCTRTSPPPSRLRRGLLWLVREFQVGAFTKRPQLMKAAEQLAKSHLHRAIKDPAAAGQAHPGLHASAASASCCPTPTIPALASPNTEVVAAALAEVRGSTVVAADGSEREVDAIVFGTGFHVTDMPIGDRILGADGRTLAEHWKDGMAALRGCAVDGFPNLPDDHRPQHRPGQQLDDPDDRVRAQLRRRLPRHPGTHRRRRPGRPTRGGPRLEREGPAAHGAHRLEHRRLPQLVPGRRRAATPPCGPAPPASSGGPPPGSGPRSSRSCPPPSAPPRR